MSLKSFRLFILLASSVAASAGCGHLLVRSSTPPMCTPIPGGLLCSDRSILFPAASGYICFDPNDIEPILERYTK